MIKCRVCGEPTGTDNYSIKEMHFGTRDLFDYTQCSNCNCLQILCVPDNLAQYYPDDYYSKQLKKIHYRNPLLKILFEARLNAQLTHRKLLSSLLFFMPKPKLPAWMDGMSLTSRSNILDVGSGAGQLLHKLSKRGFRSLYGLDPFIEKPLSYSNGVQIDKNQIWDLAERRDKQNSFDLIMMHHSLEHIPDQHRTMEAAAQLLKPAGTLLIRIPICSSWAWSHYREHWVQLDAPRHIVLHSEKSISHLAKNYDLELVDIVYDSTEFQFTGSERYKLDIPLVEGSNNDIFSAKVIEDFKNRSIDLNSKGEGDQACFIFQQASASSNDQA